MLVFAVFPVIFTYHRLLIRGYSASEAIAAVPGELAQNSLILGTPRISNGVIQYVVDSLLYVTDRLHGFDSLLLSVSAPPNPDILTSQSLALSPLGFAVPSSVWMSGVSDVGLYFAHAYWGSPASDSTHIAPTVFGQARLAFGDPAVVVASMLLGILTGVAARFYRRATPRDLAIAFTLVIAALSFERDALAMIVTAERHILALGLLLLLIRLENRSQRSGAKVVLSETHAASLVH